MKTAALYYRVSTEDQEKEGTSLQTQYEACLKFCRDKEYNVTYHFSEAYSGLSLERPELDKLRDLVRNDVVDVVVCYSIDRLSRDPVHGVILTQELEKHRVGLETVTETVDSTEVGKLITYIRGFTAKLEAEKIRERSIRGRKATTREGRMPGGFHNTYGYDYVRVIKGERPAGRVINEAEAHWVRQMFHWLVDKGLSTNQILFRLQDNSASTKNGGIWHRASVRAILTNPAYTGKTFAFTKLPGQGQFTRPKEDWIEISGVTPAIISQELFDAAQKQLQVNREKSLRNCKHEYLLRGHLRCRQCGRRYFGEFTNYRYYSCAGRKKASAPVERCRNKKWKAEKLEDIVWDEIQSYLGKPELIISQLEAKRQDVDEPGIYEIELRQVERQLKIIDRQQRQLLQWAVKEEFSPEQVETENKRLKQVCESLETRKVELETKLKASQEATVDIPELQEFINRVQSRISDLDFEGKRQALDMFDVTVWLDGQDVEITGTIEPSIVTIPSYK